ncbi:hypothetical protein QQM39_02290 [Streptomyces sp. DT2A-34]|uniref:hypothetical protein n=1 Tax=Streptomyces sp. DT2A-34 TaxID=3051182 RepID=UPI00265BC6C6|nr:hypothetical protein [Streptomyces sp. DT2A-34]MDO0909729.1 hypothetical protein [Streptomyces sp. DT2A-34]
MTQEAFGERRHVAVFSDPEHGQELSMLALIEELVRRGHRVTWATGSELAARLAISGATEDGWDVVGFLDDSSSPVDVARGYFADDLPDVVIYDKTAHAVAAAIEPRAAGEIELVQDEFVDDEFLDFLTRFGLAFVSGGPGLYRLVPVCLERSARHQGHR